MPRTFPEQPDFAGAAEQTVWEHLARQPPAAAVLDAAQCEHAARMLRRTHRAIENHQLLAREIADEGNALTREQERPAYVGLLHDLPVRWGTETEQEFVGSPVEYDEEHLPARLAQPAGEADEHELFDAIVVDEAQDFADAWWEALQPCLRDPAEGVLFVVADEHQSAFDREGRAPITPNPWTRAGSRDGSRC